MKKKSHSKSKRGTHTAPPKKQVKRPVPTQLMRGKVMKPFKKRAAPVMGASQPGGGGPMPGNEEGGKY